METRNMERRDFLKGAGLLGAAAFATTAMGGCAGTGASDTDKEPWLPEAWDYEADIVVVGHGAAGLSAAITAANESLGSVIVLEVAPEEQKGGNSRVCGQNMLIPDDPEEAIVYQRALNDMYVLDEDPAVEQELYEVWAYGLAENKQWLEDLGAKVTATTMNSHEFPDVPGSEKGATCYLIDNIVGNSAVWNFLNETKESLEVETLYETRALKVVRNPLKNEALGVEAERNGETVYVKANKGVLLACGGFECDFEMARNEFILGSTWDANNGTPWNRGDGFRMVAPFGAKLWHMNNCMGPNWTYKTAGDDVLNGAGRATFATKDYIYVGPDGKRFAYEESYSTAKHSKMLFNGIYQPGRAATPAWIIFGKQCFEAGTIFTPFSMGWGGMEGFGLLADSNEGFVDKGIIVKADTPEELAQKIGYDPETLAKTIADYNGYCSAQHDPDFHRGEPMDQSSGLLNAMGLDDTANHAHSETPGFELVPLEAPYYAVEMHVTLINTQGGPKRGAGGEVMDVFESPVPRLYAAGEFGTIYAYQYNGGGNLSEAIASGRLAARSIGALEPWDAPEEK